MYKNKKILITGATGFIGANLVLYFIKRNASITIFTRKASNKWRIRNSIKDITYYSVDLLDGEKLGSVVLKIKPEIILHTAVYGGYPFQNESEKIIKTNFTGTINLLNACRKTGFELFINTGTSSEYGIKTKPIKESDLLEPINEYGASKAASTLYCQAVAKKEDRAIVTLRLFSPYGYYEDSARLVPSVILSCLRYEDPKLASPNSVRDFIFIEDVINAYCKVIENMHKAKGLIFNIGGGAQYSAGEVVKKVVKLTGSKVVPKWGSINNIRLEPKCWQADVEKAKEILNWQPEYNLDQGLEKNIDWFKINMKEYNIK